jgi:hypothetical protein
MEINIYIYYMKNINIYLISIIVLVFIYYYYQKKSIENFESYTNCIDQGYPNDFCLQVPIQSMINPPNPNTHIPKPHNNPLI